jgi:hypothetical protein
VPGDQAGPSAAGGALLYELTGTLHASQMKPASRSQGPTAERSSFHTVTENQQ